MRAILVGGAMVWMMTRAVGALRLDTFARQGGVLFFVGGLVGIFAADFYRARVLQAAGAALMGATARAALRGLGFTAALMAILNVPRWWASESLGADFASWLVLPPLAMLVFGLAPALVSCTVVGVVIRASSRLTNRITTWPTD